MTKSQNIEYKSVWKDEYIKWICGFANAVVRKIFLLKNELTERTACRDLKELVDKEILIKQGNNKNTIYLYKQ